MRLRADSSLTALRWLLLTDTVEKLALIAGSAADSISQLIWEIVGDDGTEEGNAGGVVLRVLA